MDLESACRHIPIHLGDQYIFGITWNNMTYSDRVLLFRLHSVPKIFSAVADMMTWALHRAGIAYLTHIEDFIFLVPPQMGNRPRILALARKVFANLGVPVAEHKTEGPSCCITFLHLGGTGNKLCPVAAMLGYQACRPQERGHSFYFR